MLGILLTIVHVIVALVLILVVLLQTGKRADLAGAFGGGGSQTAFGTRGAATLLSKATTAAAVMFMITSLGLSLVTVQDSSTRGTVLEEVEAPADEATAPPAGDPAASQPLPEAPAATAGAEETEAVPEDDPAPDSTP